MAGEPAEGGEGASEGPARDGDRHEGEGGSSQDQVAG